MGEEVTNEEQVTLPTVYEYSVRVYQTMKEEASTESLGPQYGDEEGLVWEGFSTKLIERLNLPTPYYTKVFGELKRMDCLRQLRRGGNTAPSRWLLVQPPTVELFLKMQPSRKPDAKTSVQQQINDLNNRMGRIEEALGL
jgi:hypothetical protein